MVTVVHHRAPGVTVCWCVTVLLLLLLQIQVTRRWWNFEGVAVPAHLAQQLQLMDTLVMGPEQQQQQQQQQQ
jgi:hypothetical protein